MVRIGNGRYVILCSECEIPLSASVFNEEEEEILVKHEAVLELFEDNMKHLQCQEAIATYYPPLNIDLTPKLSEEVSKIIKEKQDAIDEENSIAGGWNRPDKPDKQSQLSNSEVLSYLTELSKLQKVSIEIKVSPTNPALKMVKTPIVQKPPRSMSE